MIEGLVDRSNLRTFAGGPPSRLPHLIGSHQITREWLEQDLFLRTDAIRDGIGARPSLAGRSLFSLFYEPSFLTRNSFERAMSLLGGHTQFTEDASQFFPMHTNSRIGDTVRFLSSLHFDSVVIRSNQPGAIEAAAQADTISVINGGSDTDHPTQAILDIYTILRELGTVDGIKIAVAGRTDHRNVNALLIGLAQFRDVEVILVPFTGKGSPEVLSYCESAGMKVRVETSITQFAGELNAIYVNGADTAAHTRLMLDRGLSRERIDQQLLQELRPDCIILDPMQRSESLVTCVKDERWAGYRQAENGLYVRMALLSQMLALGPG